MQQTIKTQGDGVKGSTSPQHMQQEYQSTIWKNNNNDTWGLVVKYLKTTQWSGNISNVINQLHQ
jgi:hypothetical protein